MQGQRGLFQKEVCFEQDVSKTFECVEYGVTNTSSPHRKQIFWKPLSFICLSGLDGPLVSFDGSFLQGQSCGRLDGIPCLQEQLQTSWYYIYTNVWFWPLNYLSTISSRSKVQEKQKGNSCPVLKNIYKPCLRFFSNPELTARRPKRFRSRRPRWQSTRCRCRRQRAACQAGTVVGPKVVVQRKWGL